ncbi:MAG: carboxypeptidase-like regulatory domain-containing protein [Nannocystaceae bacterium]|nr:carboxypeptidase-like regulatory domain-containing protein [Nannocystaceae bacterium]
MSHADGGSARTRPPPPGRWLAFAILLGVLVGVPWWLGRQLGEPTAQPDAAATDDDAAITPQGASQPVARIRGVVLLEVPRASEPADVVDDTDGDDAAPPTPPPVDTAPPPPQQCRITAWQQGREVATPAACSQGGAFELWLLPGVAGRVAVELQVADRLRAVVETELPPGAIGRLPTVALGIGERLGGTLVDGRGNPVAGAVVTARPNPDLDEPEPWRATTDGAGRFLFDTLPPGPVTLRAEPPGHAPSVLEALAPEADVQLVVDALFDLRGRVVGPTEALARARVRLEGSGVWPAREVACDATGAFVVPGIVDGVYALQAIAPAASPGAPEYASIVLESVDPSAELTLVLAHGYRIPVRVLDEDGNAVVDARVTVGNAHLGLLQLHERTDAAGSVFVGPVPSGSYVVRADADGYLPSEPAAVDVAEAAAEEVVLRVARPGSITGIVVDADDRAVAGAWIEVESDAPYSVGEQDTRRELFDRAIAAAGSLGVTAGAVPEIPMSTWHEDDSAPEPSAALVSDADGRFALEGLVPGLYTLRARHGRYAASDTVVVRVFAGHEQSGVRLVLREGEPLTGRVLDGNRRPLADATVELDDGSRYGTNWRGEFDAGLRSGAVELVARAPGLVATTRRVVVAAATDVELVLQPADAIVRGHVLDDNLRPLASAQVSLGPESPLQPTEVTWTDARGQFRFDAVAAGTVTLQIEHPRHASATVSALAAEPGAAEELEIVLRRGWSLRVDVRDAATGFAIPGASVIAGDRRDRTDRGGIVVFEALADDSVVVTVEAQDYSGRSRTAARDQDHDRVELVVELAQGGTVSGVVTDWAGDPVASAQVVVEVDGEAVAELRTDARGRFRAAGIPEGPIVLRAAPPSDREQDLAPVAQSSDVLRGRTTSGIDLRFDRR